MDMIAQRFGPGFYRIVCGNGPSARRNSTIEVTPEFAEKAGWAAPPQPMEIPNPIQMQARQTFERALQGPVQPLELAAMNQAAVDSALEKRRPQETGFDSLMKGFELANTLQTRALEQAKTVLGIAPSAGEPKEVGWPEVALQVVPAILDGLKMLAVQQHAGAPAQPQAPAQPVVQAQPTLPQHQPETRAMEFPVPPMETRPILGLMRQYAAHLEGPLNSPTSPDDLARQLSGLVGADLDESVLATADYVQANGPAILGNVAPFFATEKAAQVVTQWAKIIREQMAE
jgi:hypothetical protein